MMEYLMHRSNGFYLYVLFAPLKWHGQITFLRFELSLIIAWFQSGMIGLRDRFDWLQSSKNPWWWEFVWEIEIEFERSDRMFCFNSKISRWNNKLFPVSICCNLQLNFNFSFQIASVVTCISTNLFGDVKQIVEFNCAARYRYR